MQSIALKYRDDIGIVYSKTFIVLALRGFDDVDSVQFFPPVVNRYVDGSARTQFQGFRRIITVDLGVVPADADRLFIHAFMLANIRSMLYVSTKGIEEIILAPDNFEHENEWLDGCEYARAYRLIFAEDVVRTTWPQYIPIPEPEPEPVQTCDIMYIKNKVKIEGTQASPETFTTNVGKLLTDETGVSYPSISLLSYAATVMCNATPYQQAAVNLVSPVTNYGTDLTFQIAVSDAGNPSGDGYYYADIIIGLQARPS